MTATVDLQAMVDRGWQVCSCGALCQPEAVTCRFCSAPLAPRGKAATDDPVTRVAAPKKVRKPSPPRGKNSSLLALPGACIELTVKGDPIPQGSVSAPTTGVIKRSSGPELEKWRRSISRAAARACGPGWVPVNGPLHVDIIFTVPPPLSAQAPDFADGYRDLDKLVRAVGDALSPSKKRGAFRLVESDMRFTSETTAKTWPRPLHTHPAALTEPGVYIRIIDAATHAAWLYPQGVPA